MNASFPVLVSVIGLAVAAIGLIGITAPVHLGRALRNWRLLTGLPVTFAIRVVSGVIFVIAAPDCRLPAITRGVGFLELGGAAVLLGLGSHRLGRFVEWWLRQPAAFVRCWCLGAVALGSLLLYAGA